MKQGEKKKKALSVKVLLQLPVRRCITRSGAPSCAQRGRELAPGQCGAVPRSGPAPAATSTGTAGTDRARDHPPRRGPSGEGVPSPPRGAAQGSRRLAPGAGAGHRAQSGPAGPAGAPRVRLPGRPPCKPGISLQTYANVGTPGFARGGGVKPSLMRGWLFG